MTKKVTLPREVAEAIEGLRRLDKDNRWIIEAANGITTGTHSLKIRVFAQEECGNFDKILSALVNGYEIGMTPEDHVRDYHARLTELAEQSHSEADHDTESEMLSEITGIVMTLNLLGIKIEGINA